MKIKRLDDFLDIVNAKYKRLYGKGLKISMRYGLRMLSIYIRREIAYSGGSRPMIYTGKLFKNEEYQQRYWKINAIKMERLHWQLDKREWDGYYYFAISKEKGDALVEYLKGVKHSKGNFPVVTFKNICLYKNLSELKVVLASKLNYIMRMPYPEDCGWFLYKKKISINDFEFYEGWNHEEKKYNKLKWENRSLQMISAKD